jgi:hypothetical protein
MRARSVTITSQQSPPRSLAFSSNYHFRFSWSSITLSSTAAAMAYNVWPHHAGLRPDSTNERVYFYE